MAPRVSDRVSDGGRDSQLLTLPRADIRDSFEVETDKLARGVPGTES